MPAQSNILPFFMLLFLAAIFAALWTLISFAISAASGWYKLSKRFRAEQEPSGPVLSVGPLFYIVYMRFRARYSFVIRMTAAEDALYLSVLLPLRLFHPPLRIPWNEVEAAPSKFFFRHYVVLTLGAQERIPMRITERMATKLGIPGPKIVFAPQPAK